MKTVSPILEHPEVSIAIMIEDYNFPNLDNFLTTELSNGHRKIEAEAMAPSLFLSMGPSKATAKTKNSPEVLLAQPIKPISNILNPKALSNATNIDSHDGVAIHGNMSIIRGSNLH